MSKPDPSYKSKRYRDKLRHEVRDLEDILPIDRTAIHRKLDSQTVFRMSIAFFRTKLFLQDIIHTTKLFSGSRSIYNPTLNLTAKQQHDPMLTSPHGELPDIIDKEFLLQTLDGFLLVLTTDGTIMYVSNNILHHLGFNQIDLVMRCIYGIVHPDDHCELKTIIEQSLISDILSSGGNQTCCMSHIRQGGRCRRVSFLCRMKCFNGATTGYLKMHCSGHLRSFPNVVKSQRTTNQLLFAFCRPFISVASESGNDNRKSGFWTKHDLDLKFKQMDPLISDTIGYTVKQLEGNSFYQYVHPEDLFIFKSCHKTLINTEEIHTIYFRIQHQRGQWIWVHTRGKVVFKNSKKYSIVFTHCPVREEDSTYIQQEVVLRRKNAIDDLMYNPISLSSTQQFQSVVPDRITFYPSSDNEPCPSSWHTAADRHSPVFPNTHHAPAAQLYSKKVENISNSKISKIPSSNSPSTAAGDILQSSTQLCPHAEQNKAGFVSSSASYLPNAAIMQHEQHQYLTGHHQQIHLQQNHHQQSRHLHQQVYRQYHLQFNGIGISSSQCNSGSVSTNEYPHGPGSAEPSNQTQVMQTTAAMLIQGHMTAVETNIPSAHGNALLGGSESMPCDAYTDNSFHKYDNRVDIGNDGAQNQGNSSNMFSKTGVIHGMNSERHCSANINSIYNNCLDDSAYSSLQHISPQQQTEYESNRGTFTQLPVKAEIHSGNHGNCSNDGKQNSLQQISIADDLGLNSSCQFPGSQPPPYMNEYGQYEEWGYALQSALQ